MTKDLRVNADRMLASFNQLALIGATAEGGVNRPALSEAHLASRQWFARRLTSSLEFAQMEQIIQRFSLAHLSLRGEATNNLTRRGDCCKRSCGIVNWLPPRLRPGRPLRWRAGRGLRSATVKTGSTPGESGSDGFTDEGT
jgi:hypothetical protein